MIVDCHTHIWASTDQLGRGLAPFLHRSADAISAEPADHAISAASVTCTFVMGYRSRFLDADVPNSFIGDYIASRGAHLIGIAAADPTDPDALADAEQCLDRTEFRGLVVSPCDQNFHPADSRASGLYALANERRAVLFVRQGMHFHAASRMEYARPILLDEIAREFPSLTMVITSLGYPWIHETLALLGKHERLFADIAGVVRHPWLAYNALATAHQYGVMDKVLLGSGFPVMTAAAAIETVYRLHEMTHGTDLPTVPREALRGMIERDSLAALGIAREGDYPPPVDDTEQW